jgi:hypothetical protein
MIELLVIMSACTVLLTLTGVLLHRAMRIQMQSRAHVDAERTSLRLANQFRRDVHRARSAATGNSDPDENPFVLRLEFADGRTAEYSRDGGTVLRLESGGGKPAWREEFVFSAVDEIKIEDEDAPRRLILTMTAKPPAPPATVDKRLVRTRTVPMSIQAEAVVGRDSRFLAATANQEALE